MSVKTDVLTTWVSVLQLQMKNWEHLNVPCKNLFTVSEPTMKQTKQCPFPSNFGSVKLGVFKCIANIVMTVSILLLLTGSVWKWVYIRRWQTRYLLFIVVHIPCFIILWFQNSLSPSVSFTVVIRVLTQCFSPTIALCDDLNYGCELRIDSSSFYCVKIIRTIHVFFVLMSEGKGIDY